MRSVPNGFSSCSGSIGTALLLRLNRARKLGLNPFLLGATLGATVLVVVLTLCASSFSVMMIEFLRVEVREVTRCLARPSPELLKLRLSEPDGVFPPFDVVALLGLLDAAGGRSMLRGEWNETEE